MSPSETICMKFQGWFSGKKNNKKNIINLLSAKFTQRVVNNIYCTFNQENNNTLFLSNTNALLYNIHKIYGEFKQKCQFV